jgi:hypothetical protein
MKQKVGDIRPENYLNSTVLKFSTFVEITVFFLATSVKRKPEKVPSFPCVLRQ